MTYVAPAKWRGAMSVAGVQRGGRSTTAQDGKRANPRLGGLILNHQGERTHKGLAKNQALAGAPNGI